MKKLSIEALQLLEAEHFRSAWHIKLIQKAHAYTVDPFLRNLPVYARESQAYDDISLAALNTVPGYGNIHAPHHMFNHTAVDWNIRLWETQITQALAYFLEDSRLACWYFLRALWQCAGVDVPYADQTSFLHTAKVETEVSINPEKGNKSRRIDLCIRWLNAQHETSLAVIEFKFENSVGKGQLAEYRNYANKETQAKGAQHYLFLVFQNLGRKSRKYVENYYNKATWSLIQWIPLLKKWESALSNDTATQSDNFSRFRHTLWQRAL